MSFEDFAFSLNQYLVSAVSHRLTTHSSETVVGNLIYCTSAK